MVIYGEYLFLENSMAGFMILLFTARICGFKPTPARLAIGSGLSGIYSFIIFFEAMPLWCALISKLGFSLCLVGLVFPSGKFKKIFKTMIVFYIVSFASGGIVIASLYFFGGRGIAARGIFYLGAVTYARIISGMALAWICLYCFSNILKVKLRKERSEAKLSITLGNQTMTLNGFVDTGNFLKDPISGRPVCIAAKEALDGLILEDAQFCIIPYKSLESYGGLLNGLKPDKAVLMPKGKKPRAVNIILAISEGGLPADGNGEQYDVLLHEALVEGGVLQIG